MEETLGKYLSVRCNKEVNTEVRRYDKLRFLTLICVCPCIVDICAEERNQLDVT
jgi:hypothetical protein